MDMPLEGRGEQAGQSSTLGTIENSLQRFRLVTWVCSFVRSWSAARCKGRAGQPLQTRLHDAQFHATERPWSHLGTHRVRFLPLDRNSFLEMKGQWSAHLGPLSAFHCLS